MIDRPHRAWPIEQFACMCACVHVSVVCISQYPHLHICRCMLMCVYVCAVMCLTACRCVWVCVCVRHRGECRVAEVREGQKDGAAPSCRAKRHPATPPFSPIPLLCQWERAAVLLLLTHAHLHTHICTDTHMSRPAVHSHVYSSLQQAKGVKGHMGDICRARMDANAQHGLTSELAHQCFPSDLYSFQTIRRH